MIKLGKRHDEIVHWLFNKPEEILVYFDIGKPFLIIDKDKQTTVNMGNRKVGHFDVVLTVKKEEKVFVFNFIVNVKLESATEQLRAINEISAAHKAYLKRIPGAISDQEYIIVSENNEFESFFTDDGYGFYKY